MEYLLDRQIATELRYRLLTAENKLEETRSRLYLQAEGTIEERKSQVQTHPSYLLAKDELAVADSEWTGHQQHTNGARMICELWRSEAADARFVR